MNEKIDIELKYIHTTWLAYPLRPINFPPVALNNSASDGGAVDSGFTSLPLSSSLESESFESESFGTSAKDDAYKLCHHWSTFFFAFSAAKPIYEYN